MEEQDTIDLREVKNVAVAYRARLIALIVATTVFAAGIAFSLPKKYESTVLVQTKKQEKMSSLSASAGAALALLGGSGPTSATKTYIELIQSRSVLEPVIAQLNLPGKDKIQAADFAKGYLKIENAKGTDMLVIAATSQSPIEAQFIAKALLTSLQQQLTRLNQADTSLMVKFLKERITIAKQEMEQAERNLEKFRQQEKIYVPDEQAKAVVLKLTDFDQKIAQIRVQNEANEAKLQGVAGQLAQQNKALANYQLSDNPVIQQIRSKIVDKQVQMVSMQQRFTDKHPGIILLKQEIDELAAKLKQEVVNSVRAGTNTLNPVHANLLLDKVQTEISLSVGQASVEALQKVQADNEQEISKLSANSLTYIGLERQVKIAQEVYKILVQNYEQNRVQEAMESMDIQVVDEPNLPTRHSGPKRVLITAVGGVLGVMMACVYLVFLYIKKSSLKSKEI